MTRPKWEVWARYPKRSLTVKLYGNLKRKMDAELTADFAGINRMTPCEVRKTVAK